MYRIGCRLLITNKEGITTSTREYVHLDHVENGQKVYFNIKIKLFPLVDIYLDFILKFRYRRGRDMNELISATIAASVTLITIAITSKNDKNKIFSDVVTKQRINTINIMRNLVADVCVLLKNNCQDDDKKNKLTKDIYMLKMLLSIHYERNGNDLHFALEQLLDSIIKSGFVVTEKEIEVIINTTKFILDYEWGRIKSEAGGIND